MSIDMIRTIKRYLSFVKFAHTVFALPFALLGYVIAIAQPEHVFTWRLLFLVLLCMVFARSAAMGFNRYLDRDIDAINERTKDREIPRGVISPPAALVFVIANCLLFVATTWFINPLCFYLSPVALAVVLGYSYFKRWSVVSHFILGSGLGLAPIGAYLAVTGAFNIVVVFLGIAVMLWVAGFDIIYSLQDISFDRKHGLQSVPAWLGGRSGLRVSEAVHSLSAVLMLYVIWQLDVTFATIGWLAWIGVGIYVLLIIYQHTIVSSDDLSKVNVAFFTTNGVASIVFSLLTILDFYC